VDWTWVVLAVAVLGLVGCAAFLVWYYLYIKRTFVPQIVRIFREKPLFNIPRGKPEPSAEEIRLQTPDGMTLRACHLAAITPRKRGTILFGLEYGSNRWSCVPYTQFLRDNGFDIFTFEPRSQGESDTLPGYEPMQWVTAHEVLDFQTAIAYLKVRLGPEAGGFGFFGISKGGGAGLMAAVGENRVRCFVTDGIFATRTTMVPYMRKWVAIYNDQYWLQRILPNWFYGMIARMTLRRVRQETGLRFPHLEKALPQLAGRPLLMIHGRADTYIKPEMAKTLFDLAGEPRELWLVDGAKHNQALQVATTEYQRRVLEFFERHLCPDDPRPTLPGVVPAPAAAAKELAAR
jgi:uncharacterized protein